MILNKPDLLRAGCLILNPLTNFDLMVLDTFDDDNDFIFTFFLTRIFPTDSILKKLWFDPQKSFDTD